MIQDNSLSHPHFRQCEGLQDYTFLPLKEIHHFHTYPKYPRVRTWSHDHTKMQGMMGNVVTFSLGVLELSYKLFNFRWGEWLPGVSDTVPLWHFWVSHSRWARPRHNGSSFASAFLATSSFTWTLSIPVSHWYHSFNKDLVNTYLVKSCVLGAKDGKANKVQSFRHRVHISKMMN